MYYFLTANFYKKDKLIIKIIINNTISNANYLNIKDESKSFPFI